MRAGRRRRVGAGGGGAGAGGGRLGGEGGETGGGFGALGGGEVGGETEEAAYSLYACSVVFFWGGEGRKMLKQNKTNQNQNQKKK